MDDIDFRLLNEFQHDFPLCSRPYAVIGERIGAAEAAVMNRLRELHARGCVSRIGATFTPGRLGAATLAAAAVPPARLDAVAALVNGYREVNHNYEREHEFNLWFVVTAPDAARVQVVTREIEHRARCGKVLGLPMLEAYYLDLGFALGPRNRGANGATRCVPPSPICAEPYPVTAAERALLGALQKGLPIAARPYAEIGLRCGRSEDAVIASLRLLLRERVIGRFGIIVRHRKLGYGANAMVIWDVPDGEVSAVGQRVARSERVSLCYRRLRHPPLWPYNFYCMIHGTSREAVAGEIAQLVQECGLERYAHAVLFSRRCFKQRGARYVEENTHGRDRPPDRQFDAERISHH